MMYDFRILLFFNYEVDSEIRTLYYADFRLATFVLFLMSTRFGICVGQSDNSVVLSSSLFVVQANRELDSNSDDENLPYRMDGAGVC